MQVSKEGYVWLSFYQQWPFQLFTFPVSNWQKNSTRHHRDGPSRMILFNNFCLRNLFRVIALPWSVIGEVIADVLLEKVRYRHFPWPWHSNLIQGHCSVPTYLQVHVFKWRSKGRGIIVTNCFFSKVKTYPLPTTFLFAKYQPFRVKAKQIFSAWVKV